MTEIDLTEKDGHLFLCQNGVVVRICVDYDEDEEGDQTGDAYYSGLPQMKKGKIWVRDGTFLSTRFEWNGIASYDWDREWNIVKEILPLDIEEVGNDYYA
jgi:hypothetical protein